MRSDLLARLGMRIADACERWFPDAFIFALAAIVVVFLGAWASGVEARKLVVEFGGGFWSLVIHHADGASDRRRLRRGNLTACRCPHAETGRHSEERARRGGLRGRLCPVVFADLVGVVADLHHPILDAALVGHPQRPGPEPGRILDTPPTVFGSGRAAVWLAVQFTL